MNAGSADSVDSFPFGQQIFYSVDASECNRVRVISAKVDIGLGNKSLDPVQSFFFIELLLQQVVHIVEVVCPQSSVGKIVPSLKFSRDVQKDESVVPEKTLGGGNEPRYGDSPRDKGSPELPFPLYGGIPQAPDTALP